MAIPENANMHHINSVPKEKHGIGRFLNLGTGLGLLAGVGLGFAAAAVFSFGLPIAVAAIGGLLGSVMGSAIGTFREMSGNKPEHTLDPTTGQRIVKQGRSKDIASGRVTEQEASPTHSNSPTAQRYGIQRRQQGSSFADGVQQTESVGAGARTR